MTGTSNGKQFEFINLFRAVAAFWVVAGHCLIWGGWPGTLLPSPRIAVDLFMIISGYLMASNASARSASEPYTNAKNWLRFWIRRFFRIAPAYFLSLALAFILGGYFLAGYQQLQSLNPAPWTIEGVYDPAMIQYSLGNMVLHLSFLFGLHPTYAFSTFLPDWSLSLEMQFYFVFPILFLVMQRFGFLKSALLIGLPVYALGWAISKQIYYPEPSLLFFKLNYFLAGIMLFRFLSPNTTNRERLMLVIGTALLIGIDLRYGLKIVVTPCLLLSMFVLGWLEVRNIRPSWLSRLVNSRVVRFASNTSYGAYLFHGFFISAAGLLISGQEKLLALLPQPRVILMFLFVSLLTYPTAYLVYRFIELPGVGLGKQVLERLWSPNFRPNSTAI